MHTVEFPDLNKKIKIPSCFDEMKQDDIVVFAHLYLEFQKGMIDLAKLKTEMVFQFLGVRMVKWRFELLKLEEKNRIYENVYLISEKLDFFFNEEHVDGKIILKVNFPWTNNLIPIYERFRGPEKLMADISFLEYKNAHVSAIEYLQSKKENDLNWFVANLYRRHKIFWMPKPKYDEFKVKKFAERVAKWPFSVKYAILLNFLAWEEYIRTGVFTVDGNQISFSILFEKSKNSENDDAGTGLTGLLFSLAETGVFGNVKATSEQNLYDVLFRLYQLKREKMEMDKKLKK